MSVPGEQPGQQQHARDSAADRFAEMYALSPIGIALADRDGVIVEANRALTEMLERTSDPPIGTRLTALGATDRAVETLADGAAAAAERERTLHREQLQLTHSDGPRWFRVTMLGLTGDTPGPNFPVLMVEDANELHMLQEMLRKQTVTDPLTGLGNNAGFVGQLDTLPSLQTGQRVALVYLDIDGFSVINDGLGAEVADSVLGGVARKLRATFTAFDAYVARVAGDGFAVLLHGEFNAAAITRLVDELIIDLNEPVYVDEDTGVGVSVSAGITVHETPVAEPADLLRAAEITVHRAKRGGKAQWMLHEPELDAADRDRYELGAVIAGGLEQGEFELEYQPTIKLDGSGQIVVINAALRWNHPRRGMLTEPEFYPLADATGMTLPLGRWLLDAAMAEAANWHQRFGDDAPDLCLRLPQRLTTDPDLVGMVRERLERNGLPARKVRLCADSTALLDSQGEASESLALLAELDVQIALAVAGAADLELIRSHKLPVGFLMLSESLVATADDAAEGSSIHLRSLVRRAHELGLRRIGAEGVHSGSQVERLRELGVVAGRGSLFGAASESAEIESLLGGNAS